MINDLSGVGKVVVEELLVYQTKQCQQALLYSHDKHTVLTCKETGTSFDVIHKIC